MILDIIKERMKFSSTQLKICRWGYGIAILLGGKISFFMLISALFMFQAVINHIHIDYLIPMTDEEKKVRDIVSIFLVNIEYMTLFIIGTVLSGYIYGYSDMIKENFYFILIWTILMFVCSLQNGLMILENWLSGTVNKNIKTMAKEDGFSTFVEIISLGVLFVMSYQVAELFFMDKGFDFIVSTQGIIIFLVVLCLFIIEIFRRCKRITVGDFYEIVEQADEDFECDIDFIMDILD